MLLYTRRPEMTYWGIGIIPGIAVQRYCELRFAFFKHSLQTVKVVVHGSFSIITKGVFYD